MIRSVLLRGPTLMALYPFDSNNLYDKPVNKVLKPLIEDECGWDRVKRIFRLNEDKLFTKELQSIINVTVTGAVSGLIIGGMIESKNTVNNFIANNEATRFINQSEAKRALQREVFISFVKKGVVLGKKLGLFCLMFSTLTTCTTAYRGKIAVENYIFGGFVTGLLYKMNLGLRGSLVGAGFGSVLGGVCGSVTTLLLYLSGITIDEILQTQHNWITSRNEATDAKIRAHIAAQEDFQEKNLFEQNQKLRLAEQQYQEAKYTKKVEDPSI
ncbi:RPII140-upstream gene protein [Odontomachus brunneus]|uniref:RPII140-upstream gene protein n=1 Tax=Odontomachus brunneus TaxID=486640 RepID=UPI0013F26C49|nr:RPII140-upstream gene protein [Odontomachus brunneus]XP_032686105.1 RPII140-upstream gene protein [Odontomachus brunneus]XP_032686106.1 RPII140-upstream gene protein [Odontomachus brunneus]